jgi:two-component system NtrC family sensor kinase
MGVFCAGARSPFSNEKINILSAVVDLLANAVYRQSLVDNLQIQVETLRKTRMQLAQSEKLAAIGELVAGVAHELNNPLTTISLWAELLQQQSISEQERYDLSKIVSEARRAANIVHSLLDFSRQHTPERKPIDINVLIQSTVDMVNFELKKNNVSCQLKLSADIPLTVADPYQIKQVFLNLLNNANQAMKSDQGKGTLNIYSEMGSTQYYNQINHQTNVIRVVFEDNGVGISPAMLPKIFDPFFTTKPEGTGLGLSVCHGIITEHGGNIWAESGPQGGTRMFVELPIETPTQEAEEVDAVPSKFTSGNLARILVIEDEPAVLEVVQRALMRKGYLVEGTESGQEGLELLESQSYDLILCDIRMPGMSGIEFYQKLEKKKPEMLARLIFTTGDTISPGSQSFLKLINATVLPKPFELEKLLVVVREKLTKIDRG